MSVFRLSLAIVSIFFFRSSARELTFPLGSPSQIENPCTTPLNKQGQCVELNTCRALDDMLRKKDRKSVEFLKLSNCGFHGKTPYVCCPTSERVRPTCNTPNRSEELLVPNNGKGNSNNSDIQRHTNLRLLRQDICGNDFSGKIYGGQEANMKQFPWMALIQKEYEDGPKTICGGSLLNERYVMTAAHCVTGNRQQNSVTILLGEHNILTDPDCTVDRGNIICGDPVQRFKIEEVIMHPKYNKQTKSGDIALVRLDRAAPMTEYISPICLPGGEAMKKNYVGDKLFVAGWGFTENETLSNVKRWVKVPVVSNADCGKRFERSFDETQMCAGGVNSKDSCRSDSGGPLMTIESVVPNRPGAQWVAVGIVAAGVWQCGTQDAPAIYTRVSPYVNWILDNLKP